MTSGREYLERAIAEAGYNSDSDGASPQRTTWIYIVYTTVQLPNSKATVKPFSAQHDIRDAMNVAQRLVEQQESMAVPEECGVETSQGPDAPFEKCWWQLFGDGHWVDVSVRAVALM